MSGKQNAKPYNSKKRLPVMLSMLNCGNDEFEMSNDSDDDNEEEEEMMEDYDNVELGEVLDTVGIVLDDLSWRVEKVRLEEQNIQRFLKARPRFLPYNECRKWVQAFNRWNTEEDWNEWISMGEKRNAYIPVR
jgi:hypothetical protein